MKDILLLTPPFTQLNTPYPATAYLKGFLNTINITSFQMDLGIEVILKLFSKQGLTRLFKLAENRNLADENSRRILALQNDYIKTIDEVILFLQGKNQTLAHQICSGNYLPEANRFLQQEDLEYAFGWMGIHDKAKYLSTLYLEDISDFIVANIDEHFGFSRYAEKLGRSANSFDELYGFLQKTESLIDEISLEILEEKVQAIQPRLIGFSVPFPGNLYSAFRCAQYLKHKHPGIKIAMGGGFPNTELRSVSDSRVFEFFDFITLDDGELPIELLISNIHDPSVSNPNHQLFKRTFLLKDDLVFYNNFSLRKDYKQSETGTPDYSDLLLDRYISVIEIANPMHSLWSDGRWNKLTMAHGCYWGKCTFCDVSLDYIKNYQPVAAALLVDRMEQMIQQTGERGFHFVDEAAPPALMRDVAIEIIRRQLSLSWWTNIRFEKSFSADLCRLLKASGCIAVSGGLEVASDRLLDLIKKGVTVEQVARVTRNFTEAGIMVHAYLMYGYPTQTIQETIDSLEMVRQMFEQNIIYSGFWHQFALTAHSPIGLSPAEYGIVPDYKEISFANNDIAFEDSTGIDHNQFSYGLKKSLFNYMQGLGFDFHLQEWFDFEIPETSIPENYIENALILEEKNLLKNSTKIIWLESVPQISEWANDPEEVKLIFHNKTQSAELIVDRELGEWLIQILSQLSIHSKEIRDYGFLKKEHKEFIEELEQVELLDFLRANGLLVL